MQSASQLKTYLRDLCCFTRACLARDDYYLIGCNLRSDLIAACTYRQLWRVADDRQAARRRSISAVVCCKAACNCCKPRSYGLPACARRHSPYQRRNNSTRARGGLAWICACSCCRGGGNVLFIAIILTNHLLQSVLVFLFLFAYSAHSLAMDEARL